MLSILSISEISLLKLFILVSLEYISLFSKSLSMFLKELIRDIYNINIKNLYYKIYFKFKYLFKIYGCPVGKIKNITIPSVLNVWIVYFF